jgi:DNA-binding transcriptional LysR family regulator
MRIVEDARLAYELLGDLLTDATGVPRASLLPVDFANPYLAPLIVAFARRYPGVGVDLDLTTRKVHLVSEPFDVASRVGQPADSNLIASARPATLRCALYAALGSKSLR